VALLGIARARIGPRWSAGLGSFGLGPVNPLEAGLGKKEGGRKNPWGKGWGPASAKGEGGKNPEDYSNQFT